MTAQRVRLTPGRVRAAKCPDGKGQAILRDAEQPGLGLRVTAGGSKSYVFQAKLAGKSIRMTIGDTQTLTIGDARARAAELRVQVLEGRDPRQVKAETTARDLAARKQAKAETAPALEAWQEYIDARAGRWSERHRRDHLTMTRAGGEPITRGKRAGMGRRKKPGILRPLLELPLCEIDSQRVQAWADHEASHRPTRTRLALALLQAFLNWCSRQARYADQVDTDAPAGIKRDLPKPKPRNDCLEREQLQAWFSAVRQISNPTIAAYLQMLLLTGARRGELAALRWRDVDMRWGKMTIRDKASSQGGNDGTRQIPLTPYVHQLLLELKRPRVVRLSGQPVKRSPWVFSSATSASGHITEPRIAHVEALKSAGLPHVSIHGLRRSFATLSEWVEVPTGVVAQIMGHRPSAIAERHYKRRPLDLLRVWHVRIESWILEQAGMQVPRQEEEGPATSLVAM